MSNESESPPLSPRIATLHEMMTTQFQTLRREMEQMRVEYDKSMRYRANDYSRRRRARREARRERRHEEDRLEGVKIKVPTFIGKNDPEAYLEWELKMEQVFECNSYQENKKVKDQLNKERRRVGAEPIDSWLDMKLIMRR
ncbi:hypothetical protein Lal_00044253, partial [Lupinus albus]